MAAADRMDITLGLAMEDTETSALDQGILFIRIAMDLPHPLKFDLSSNPELRLLGEPELMMLHSTIPAFNMAMTEINSALVKDP